jgi:hypothetical protein
VRPNRWEATLPGPRPHAAQRTLKKLSQEKRRGDAGQKEWLDAPFSDLADEFLDDIKARRKPTTYGSDQEMLELAQQHMGVAPRVFDLGAPFLSLHLCLRWDSFRGERTGRTIWSSRPDWMARVARSIQRRSDTPAWARALAGVGLQGVQAC